MTHKAPGKNFRKGISIIELFDMFPDDATAEHWFETQRWGANNEGRCCPRCGGFSVLPVPSGKPMPYWCGDCRRNFSVRIGTVMEKTKISYQKWAIAIYLWATSLKGVSSMKLHRDLKITQKSAWHLAQRLREAWVDKGNDMAGPIEVDESYFGGKEKNKHSHKKLHAGRGGVGKSVVVGAKDRATNAVSASVVGGTDAKTLHGFVGNRAAQDATVYTDDHSGYAGIRFKHGTVKHSIGEYVDNMVHTNGIESF